MKQEYKIHTIVNTWTILAMLAVFGFVGFYYGNVLRGGFVGALFSFIFLFINNLEPQVIKEVYTPETDELQLKVQRFMIFTRNIALKKSDLTFNYHNYNKQFGTPIEIYLTAANGSVYKITSKFWERKRLVLLAKEVWNTGVLSTKIKTQTSA